LEECPPKLSSNPLIDVDNKPLVPTLLGYKKWITSKKKYLDWLYSDLAAIGLM